MFKLGQYLAADTVIHRLDPRVKIAAVLAISLLIFAAGASGIVLISLFLAAVLWGARMAPAQAAAAVKPVTLFMAVIFLMHLLLTEGEPLLKLAPLPLTVTREGLMQGAYVIWQFAALVLTAAVLTMTTLPSDLVGGIERLLRPLARVGFPSQEIAVMMSMALRFLPILLEETERLQTAMLARGADFTGGGLGRRTRSFASLAVPLLLSAFRRADDLVLAMEARGYRRGPRTTLRELRLAESDYAALAVIAAFAAANLGLRFIA